MGAAAASLCVLETIFWILVFSGEAPQAALKQKIYHNVTFWLYFQNCLVCFVIVIDMLHFFRFILLVYFQRHIHSIFVWNMITKINPCSWQHLNCLCQLNWALRRGLFSRQAIHKQNGADLSDRRMLAVLKYSGKLFGKTSIIYCPTLVSPGGSGAARFVCYMFDVLLRGKKSDGILGKFWN